MKFKTTAPMGMQFQVKFDYHKDVNYKPPLFPKIPDGATLVDVFDDKQRVTAYKENFGKVWAKKVDGIQEGAPGAMAFLGDRWAYTSYNVNLDNIHPKNDEISRSWGTDQVGYNRAAIVSGLVTTSTWNRDDASTSPVIFGSHIGKTYISALLLPASVACKGLLDSQQQDTRFHVLSADTMVPYYWGCTVGGGTKSYDPSRKEIVFPSYMKAEFDFQVTCASDYRIVALTVNNYLTGKNDVHVFLDKNVVASKCPAMYCLLEGKPIAAVGYSNLAIVASQLVAAGLVYYGTPSQPDTDPFASTPSVSGKVAPVRTPKKQASRKPNSGSHFTSDVHGEGRKLLPPELQTLPTLKQGFGWVVSNNGMIFISREDGNLHAPFELFDLPTMLAEKHPEAELVKALFVYQARLHTGMAFNYKVIGGLGDDF